MSTFQTPTNIDNQFLAFDGLELKNKIVERLNQSKTFTDQNYAGSNISALIDIISYSFGTLIFYLNKTSSESMFSEAQLYENMNRIVKILNYNPIGRQSESLPFGLTSFAALPVNSYVIPRYAHVFCENKTFSLLNDLSFSKTTNSDNEIVVKPEENSQLLKEGTIEEYPTYYSLGLENEVLYLNLTDDVLVDHFGIQVFVKEPNQKWEMWNRVENRNLHNGNDKIYEARFNHNKKYEIIFGDNVNGKKIDYKSAVAVYYLKIKNSNSSTGIGTLNGFNFTSFNSIRYKEILNDTKTYFGNYLESNQLGLLRLFNNHPSFPYSEEENVDKIRTNAPKKFRFQNKLITAEDYDFYIKTNFSNLLSHIKTVNNETYLKTHIKYLYDIGLKNPHLEGRVLINQIKFANACNFNNIYIYGIPSLNLQYLTSSQKQFILKEIDKLKILTSNVILADPEYMLFDFYLKIPNEIPSVTNLNQSVLRVFKSENSRKSNSGLKQEVANVIIKTFSKNNVSLGHNLNSFQLTTDLLNIDGVKKIQTYRKDTGTSINEISFLVWNSNYPENDSNVYTQTVYLDDFMFPVFNNIANLENRIEIIDENSYVKIPEF